MAPTTWILSVVNVPRCLRDAKPIVSKETSTFVDASIQAYGAASYLPCHHEDGTITCRLIASKSKVAPLKPITVHRLELMSAVLGLRLTQRIAAALEVPLETVNFYSDSGFCMSTTIVISF